MVLEMIDLGAHVNSPKEKKSYILNFLKRFHPNLKELITNARNEASRRKLLILVKNMKKEFYIEED